MGEEEERLSCRAVVEMSSGLVLFLLLFLSHLGKVNPGKFLTESP